MSSSSSELREKGRQVLIERVNQGLDISKEALDFFHNPDYTLEELLNQTPEWHEWAALSECDPSIETIPPKKFHIKPKEPLDIP